MYYMYWINTQKRSLLILVGLTMTLVFIPNLRKKSRTVSILCNLTRWLRSFLSGPFVLSFFPYFPLPKGWLAIVEEHSLPVTAHRFGLTLFSPGYSSPVYLWIVCTYSPPDTAHLEWFVQFSGKWILLDTFFQKGWILVDILGAF